jgi:hypothetical protein
VFPTLIRTSLIFEHLCLWTREKLVIMSDINISNGTCYTAAGERLGDDFIPCGNTAYGYQTCCGAADNCLANLACFGIHGSGYGSFLTYFAGCTDPDYQDASCPQKEVGRFLCC